MLTSEEYLYAWLAYGAGAFVFYLCWWFLVSKVPGRDIRLFLRICLLVIMVVPWYTSDTLSYLSPAWLVGVVEQLMEGEDAFWRAGRPLFIATALAGALSVIFSLVRWFWFKPELPSATTAE